MIEVTQPADVETLVLLCNLEWLECDGRPNPKALEILATHRTQAAKAEREKQVLLEIPAAPEDVGAITGIRQATTIDGQLIRVGGAGDDASLQLLDMQGRIHSGFTAKRIVAKELGKLLWEPVRLSGIGIWERTGEGEWRLEKMQVQSFETLEEEDLEAVIDKLRELDVVWPKDALRKLKAEREATL